MHLSYLYKRRLPRRLEIETVGMNALEQKDKKFAPRLPLALPTLGIGPKMAEDIIKIVGIDMFQVSTIRLF